MLRKSAPVAPMAGEGDGEAAAAAEATVTAETPAATATADATVEVEAAGLPGAVPESAGDDAEQAAAATKIQTIHRGVRVAVGGHSG